MKAEQLTGVRFRQAAPGSALRWRQAGQAADAVQTLAGAA